MTVQIPSDAAPGALPGPPAARDAQAGGGRRRPSAAGRALGRIGAVILLIQLLVAVFAPAIARHDPLLPSGSPYDAPGLAHLLGTNDLGQDLFAQLVYGARISLGLGLLAALFAVGIGLGVALLAGYLRGGVDALLMRLVDITLAFPFLPLVVVVAAFLGRELWTTVLVVAAVMWARPARVLRSQVLKVREYEHVTAAQAMGSSDAHVLGRHILPRVAPLAAAQFVRTTNAAVLIEASLAFLGLGDPNRLSWGTMLFFAQSRNALLTDAWLWWLLPPGLALSAAILGFAFVGYAVEEWADPRLAGSARPSRRTPRRLAGAEPAQPDPDAVLEIRDLCLYYDTPAGPLRAVDGVSLSVGRGRVVGLVGESGSGKSSLAMGVLRLVRPPGHVAGGSALLNGRDLLGVQLAEVERLRGRAIGLIPQSSMNALNPAYTVQRQVAEAAGLTRPGRAAQARATELLELVGIPRARHRAYPHELSGGMRQRVVIAMAIANEPELLIADEPVTGLDMITQASIMRLILDLRARLELSLLLISHDLRLVGRVADDLLVIQAGRIVERGPTSTLVADPRHPCTAALLRAFPCARVPRRPVASPPAEPPDPVVELRRVSKTYGSSGLLGRGARVTALENVSLTINQAEIIGLVGGSGAGKSTLGRLVLGLDRPDGGQVLFQATDVARLFGRKLRLARQHMHLILQDPYQSLHPGMRLAEVVAEPLVVAGVEPATRAARVHQALEEVGLTPVDSYLRRFPHELSGGQRQRVAVARALVNRPRLVVADEPTSMLDVSLRAGILDLIRHLRDRYGTACIFITHDLAVARYVSDRIGVLENGRLVEVGLAGDVIGQPHHAYTRALLAASDISSKEQAGWTAGN